MRILCLIVALFAVARGAHADPTLRVIVHPKNPITTLSKQFVADAFLKKRTRWSDDTVIQPVDLPQKHSVRAKFCKAVLDRDVGAVRRYWAQLVFSGRGVPPPDVASEDEVVAYVAKHPGSIGYVTSTVTLTGVKAVGVE